MQWRRGLFALAEPGLRAGRLPFWNPAKSVTIVPGFEPFRAKAKPD